MPTYKLLYFDFRGRGEVSRLIFKQAGVEFEDVRLPKSKWPEVKPTTPYGTMPVLEVDGKQLSGSTTIQRYLGETLGLAGSNAWENAQLDSIHGVGVDFALELMKVFFEKDESRKQELQKKLEEEAIPKYMGIFERIITENNAPGGWLFGEKVTYVDIAYYSLINFISEGYSAVLDKYPAIKKHKAAVESLPNIAKWLKERPVTAI